LIACTTSFLFLLRGSAARADAFATSLTRLAGISLVVKYFIFSTRLPQEIQAFLQKSMQ